MPDLLRGGLPVSSVFDLLRTSGQREALARLGATMSLLEGHAEVVMDAVGPEVVPGVGEIRRRFTARRRPRNLADRLLRAALGLEQKMRQYTDGAVFVRALIEAEGMSGFNHVWRGPEALPSAEEILNPELWLRRTSR